mgnify:CR=1 FL=1
MSTTQAEILSEIAAEQKELRINIILTSLTFIGLIGGVIAAWLDAPTVFSSVLYLVAYLAGGYTATRSAFSSLLQKN